VFLCFSFLSTWNVREFQIGFPVKKKGIVYLSEPEPFAPPSTQSSFARAITFFVGFFCRLSWPISHHCCRVVSLSLSFSLTMRPLLLLLLSLLCPNVACFIVKKPPAHTRTKLFFSSTAPHHRNEDFSRRQFDHTDELLLQRMDREERSLNHPDDGVSVAVPMQVLLIANVVMAVMLLVAASGGAVGTPASPVPSSDAVQQERIAAKRQRRIQEDETAAAFMTDASAGFFFY